MSDYIKENTRRLLMAFGCDNIYQFGLKQQEMRQNGYIFPSKNTLRKLLDDKTDPDTIRPGTLGDLAAIYNRKYHDTITQENYRSQALPFVNQTHVSGLYEGLFYTYSIRNNYYDKNANVVTLLGFIYLYIEDGIYKVRYLGDFRHETTLRNPYLKEFISNPSLSYADLLGHIEFLDDREKNYYGYFEGTMNLEEDFCHMNLHRPDFFPVKTIKNNLSIYLRRYNDDMRKRLYGAIGLLIGKTAVTDILFKKILLSEKLLSPDHPKIQELLSDTTMFIKDRDDYLWYDYLMEL